MTEGHGTVEGYELIPSDRYQVVYDSYDLISPRNLSDRIIMWFVITWGDYEGMLIPYFCPVRITNRKKRDFSFRKNSKFLHTIEALTGRKLTRGDRLKPSVLNGLNLVATVITVKDKQDDTPHLKDDWYSKIDNLELGS